MLLLDLNDDCLELMCGLLELEDQLSLKNVCRRLGDLVQSSWRHHCKRLTLSHDQLVKFKDSKQDFIDLMSSVSNSLIELNMDRVERMHLKWLDHLRFSKLERLNCNLYQSGIRANDEDVLLIARLFPAMIALSLLSNITGKHICSMHQLVELDLSCCEFLKTKFLVKIFSTLKLRKFALLYYGYNTLLDDRVASITNCQTLEELKIDDHHLLLFIDNLLQMPVMRKVSCYTRDYDGYLLGKIAKAHGPRIHKMIYNDVLWAKDEHIQYLLLMTQLEQLILQDEINNEQLVKIANNLGQLREFHFVDGMLKPGNGLLEIVKHCKKLEVLNISGSNVNAKLVRKINDVLCHSQRGKPLRLYCMKSKAAEENIIEESATLQQLDIHLDVYPLDLLCARVFQCEWFPKLE